MALGQNDDALAYTKKATEFDPKSASAWSNYGVVLDAIGNAPEAEQAYRKSLELNRANHAILVNLGANLTRQKKSTEAINVLAQAVRQYDNAVTHKLYADALASAERYDNALQEYDIALKKDPRYYPAMNQKADVLVAQYRKGLELDEKLKADAIALWRQSLAINPQQPRVQATYQDWTRQRLFAK
jgi:tetratricopeptide (TPR) repeat protein